jgi:hypothetical protein
MREGFKKGEGNNKLMMVIAEMKLIVAAVYTNFITHIVNDDGIEQEGGFICGPKSNRLILRFEKA